jgi:4-hydroxybenzoate polyprenyltransferase
MASLRMVRTWGEMVKFSHSVFALPFALMAAFLAGRDLEAGRPGWGHLALVVICMVAARSVAMTFNRIADAAIDARNPRTAGRPIPAGTISVRAAWGFLLFAAFIFFIGCAGFWRWHANPWPLYLAGPVLLYLCGYSYTKRLTKWSHVYLGSAIAFSPVAAWIAISPETLGWPAIVLMGAVTCWIGGFDIIYACQDLECDRRDGLHSLPARWGVARALWAARTAHGLAVILLAAEGVLAGLGTLYAVGVVIVAALLIVENALVRANDLSKVNLAFFTVNGVVSMVLGGLAIADVLLH